MTSTKRTRRSLRCLTVNKNTTQKGQSRDCPFFDEEENKTVDRSAAICYTVSGKGVGIVKHRLRRSVALLLLCSMVLSCVPIQAMADLAKSGSGVVVDEYYAAQPTDDRCAEGLGISAYQTELLREQLVSAIKSYKASVDISAYNITFSEDKLVFLRQLLLKSDPTTFHINTYRYHYDDGIFTKLEFREYLYDKATYQNMLAQCEDVAERMTYDLLNADLTLLHKALLLHDRLAVWVDYDTANFNAGTIPAIGHTLYGALVNRVAVCDAYAKAYMFLLDKVGIKSYLCNSQELNHVWNIVYLYGEYYHVDVTWDDPIWDVTGRVNHNNFLLSSNGIFASGHDAHDYDTTPQSTYYEGWFWTNSNTAFQYVNNTLYYIDNADRMLRHWTGDTLYDVLSVADKWYLSDGRYWRANYSRLSADEDYLYYSLSRAVYRYDPRTGENKVLHYPNFSGLAGYNIFGMKVENDLLYCDRFDTVQFTAATKPQYQDIARYRTVGVSYLLVESLPQKTMYGLGKTLNTKGLELKVRYTNGSSGSLSSGYTVSGFDSSVLGTQRVAVSFGGRSAYFDVQIVPACGDVDNNGAITTTDARLVLQLCAGKINGDGLDLPMTDVDQNGKCSTTDARLILRYVAGLITQYQ